MAAEGDYAFWCRKPASIERWMNIIIQMNDRFLEFRTGVARSAVLRDRAEMEANDQNDGAT